jgi:hypothetical protein
LGINPSSARSATEIIPCSVHLSEWLFKQSTLWS